MCRRPDEMRYALMRVPLTGDGSRGGIGMLGISRAMPPVIVSPVD